jgi:DNA-binding response OmpR family regulator
MSRTILIVEDETDLADTCLRLLRRQGWTAVVARTRTAAMEALLQGPALAVVDRRLPDGDGVDVLRSAVASGTPVIMMSGQDWVDTRRVALDAGAAGFLGKPFSGGMLLELVHAILGPATPVPPTPPVGPGHRGAAC